MRFLPSDRRFRLPRRRPHHTPQRALRTFLQRHSLIAGLLLMFALTWPIELANSGLLPFQVPFALSLFLGWGFIFAALIMTGLTQSAQAVVTLLRRYTIWRVGPRWYLAAFLLYPAIFLSAVALNALLVGERLDFSATMARRFFGMSGTLPLFVLPFFLFDAVANGEEMGWRGYVLPRLQARHSALGASLILGLIWGVWHLPKFLGAASGPFALFMVKTIGDAVLYTWLYNNTRGSLLLVTIFHAAGNTAGFFLPVANTVSSNNIGALVIAVVLITLIALVVTVHAGPERLSRADIKQILHRV
ncbi:MAG: CPBP family intramembrane glutamic endopeptidase, partial [Chloroflexota bacterium]